ncbi:hypothetical protein [Paenibacillus sp. OV219]|uniref:hypothetical protein n=1 Tax=Paenibacillus sp. OV219 TaxID=1884377 RepID=UPI0008AFB471|nr:hypothetical protein [Paenibacillus sp. OV219]SEO05443.1 hypothetical protein SAMN05518847_105362 [Paenibacillus sp. OV219]
MVNKKWMISTAVLGLIVLILLIITVRQHNENKYDDRYISEKLSNTVSGLSHAILENDKVLNDTLKDTKGKVVLTSLHAQMLCGNTHEIMNQMQELDHSAELLGKRRQDGNLNNVAKFTLDAELYLSRKVMNNGLLYDCTAPKSDLTLNDEQKDFLQRLQTANKEWARIVIKYIPGATNSEAWNSFWDKSRDGFVRRSWWVEMQKDFAASSGQLPLLPN